MYALRMRNVYNHTELLGLFPAQCTAWDLANLYAGRCVDGCDATRQTKTDINGNGTITLTTPENNKVVYSIAPLR